MKIRHFSIRRIWPAFGWIIAGSVAIVSDEFGVGAVLATMGLLYIAAWFTIGLFKGNR